MSQGRECCQVVVAAVGSSDSPLSHLQHPLCRPPQLAPGSLTWDGKVAPRRYLQSHQPRGPGQLGLSQVSQVPQFSYPHRIHCPLTPPSSDSSPKAWTTEAARASLTTTGPPPARGEEEQGSPWLPGQAWPLPTAGGVVGGGGRLLSSASRHPLWAPI